MGYATEYVIIALMRTRTRSTVLMKDYRGLSHVATFMSGSMLKKHKDEREEIRNNIKV